MVPLIPRRVLFGNPDRVAPTLSPDGRRLAWLAPHDGVLNVWVRDLDAAPGSGRVVTGDRDRGIQMYCWRPDSGAIMFCRDVNGDENWRLFDVCLDTGRRRDLTPFDGVQVRLVKISKQRPGQILLGINLTRPELHDVFRLDLASGELTEVCRNPGFLGLLADDDLRVRAALAPSPDGGMTIMVRDDDTTGTWRVLLTVGPPDALSTGLLAFSQDGTRLLCLTSHEANTNRLVWIDVATGERSVVAGDVTYDVSAVGLHPDTHEPRVVFIERDRLEAVVLDQTVADDITTLDGLDGGDLYLLGTDDADRVWLAATEHDDGPRRYYAYHRDSGQATFLFSNQPALDRYRLAAMQPFATVSRDGLALHGYVTFPPGIPRRNLPAVLMVHGGPWHRDTWGLNPDAQWLANRGYLCIQVNYRGSTGYGKAFTNAGDRQWGAGMHDDLLDGLKWVLGRGWVDPARVGIYGRSFGGYAALIGAAFTPGVFGCAISVAGPSSLKTMIENMPAYWSPARAVVHTRIGNPDTDADLMWERSPLSKVDQIVCPVMIVQGANDPRTTVVEAEQIVAALTANEVPHEYLLYPDEGHGLVKPENRLDFYGHAERFLAEHLRGRAQGVDDGELSTMATSP